MPINADSPIVQPLIRFPDADLWLCSYLRTHLVALGWAGPGAHGDVEVATKHERSPRGVWVRGDGGPRLDVVRAVRRFGINVFADDPTGFLVNQLAADVLMLIDASADGLLVLSARTTGPAYIDDETGQPRRYLTAELVVRGEQLDPLATT